MKVLFRIISKVIEFLIIALICYVAGVIITGYISKIFSPISPIVAGIIFASLWGGEAYLIIQARMGFNDGIGPESGAFIFGWVNPIIATTMIAWIASVGQIFLLVAAMLFLSIATIYLFFVYKNPSIAGYNRNHWSEKEHPKYLATILSHVIRTSGVITAVAAVLMYQLSWFVQK
jgi:hypothetical protein